MTQVFCSKCSKSIAPAGPRVIVAGNYVCGDCLYKLEHGSESFDRQVRLSRLAKGSCVCTPQKLKRKWTGDKLTIRSVHDKDCPKHMTWMEGV